MVQSNHHTYIGAYLSNQSGCWMKGSCTWQGFIQQVLHIKARIHSTRS